MRVIIEARAVECHTNTRENFLFTKCIVIFAHETLIINAYFIKSFSQCNEAHRRKWTIFEKTKFLKFGRDWPKVAGVAGTGCGIVSLDNLTPFHKKIIFDWRFSKILFWKKTLPFFLRQHGTYQKPDIISLQRIVFFNASWNLKGFGAAFAQT